MMGRDPYWVWHSYEAPYQLTAINAAKSLVRAGNEVHFTFHPLTGDIVQLLPANRAGRGLRNTPGGVQTNRQGRCCIQVEVIAYAKSPWTRDLTPAGRKGLAKLIGFARELDIPDVWPAGPPPAYPNGSSSRSVRLWNGPGGHFSHSQIPENTHGDPGAIDIKTLFDPLAPLENVMAKLDDEDRKWLKSMVEDVVHRGTVGYKNTTVEQVDLYQIIRDGRDAAIKAANRSGAGVTPEELTEAIEGALRTVLGSLDQRARTPR